MSFWRSFNPSHPPFLICTILCRFLPYSNTNHTPSVLSLPPFPASHTSTSSQSTRLGSPCYTKTSHQLPTLHTVVYLCWCYSPHSSHPLLPPRCPQVHPLHLPLWSLPANRCISTIFLFLFFFKVCALLFYFLFFSILFFLDFIYIYINTLYVFFSFWLHSV